MSAATHNPNVSVSVSLDAASAAQASFSSVLLLVGRSDNTLNGDRVMSLASYEEAQDAQDAGYISTAVEEAVRVAFNQDHTPDAFKLGYYDDRTPTKAFKDFGDVGGGNFDTVIEAHTAGVDGNDITVALVADGSGSVSITRSGNAVTIHFIAATSTVTNVQTAIAALSGADDIIDELEEAAFHLGLFPPDPPGAPMLEALGTLAALAVSSTQEFLKALECARGIRPGGLREDLQDFLEAIHHIMAAERQADDAHRGFKRALIADKGDFRDLFACAECARNLENAADLLLSTALQLRGHVLRTAMGD